MKKISENKYICDACIASNMKKINWKTRKGTAETLDKHRSKREYDCIVPGSGGKGSVYAAHILKYKYGINLTVTWPPILYNTVKKILKIGLKLEDLTTLHLSRMAKLLDF